VAGNYDALRKIWRDEAPLAPAEASRNGGSPLSVDKMLGYVKDVHDWAWMDDGSNDAGDNGPVVDCCQAPFSGHSSLLRMAKAVGDEREIAYASYHLAKGQLPLIGRLAFTDYGRENGLLGVDSVNVGFREFVTPHSYANSPMLVKSQRQEYDGSYDSVHCYAYHDMLEIYFPYARYAWNDLRRYEDLRKLYFPNSDVRKGSEGHFSSRLKYMLFDGSPAKDVRAIMDRMCEGSIFWVRDAIWLETMPLLLSAGSPLVLTDWAPLQAPEFSFSPSKKAAFVKFQGRVPANFVLKAVSSRRPLSVSDAKGAKLEWNYDPESFVLSIDVPQGDGRALKIAFDETDPARFMPLPIPRPRETAPSLRDEFLPVAFERAPKRAPVAGAPERKVLPQARAKTSSGSATTLFSADFSGAQGPDLAYAGVFSFHDWGKSGQKPSGGLTGAYPPDGVPAHCLEIKAAPDNFTGRSSPAMKLDPSSGAGKELVVSGQVLRSKDYKGNKPMIFLWAVDKDGKGKPLFLSLPEAPNGEWKAFEIVQPLSVAPGAERVFMNVTSQKLSGQDSVSGSVFFKELKVELR
jgi:YD repeat-containing protein